MRFVLLLAVLMLLCGCVWTRLLDMKNQFKEFDRYIDPIDDGAALLLKFKEPCIQPDDIGYLLGGDPTEKTTATDQASPNKTVPSTITCWIYQLKRARSDSIGLTLTLTSHDTLADSIKVPPEVLAFIPRDRLLAMIRAFGKAEIDQEKRQATAGLAGADAKPISPGRATVIAALGEPDSTTAVDNEIQRLTYVFHLVKKGTPDVKDSPETTLFLDLKAERLVELRLQAPRFSTWVKLDGSTK